MKESVHIGKNKTGLGVAPRFSREMLDNQDDEFKLIAEAADDPFPNLTHEDIKKEYIREWGDIGSVPPPPTLKGVAVSGIQKISGGSPEVLVDKMGERLAFERSGARLYEAFILKCESALPETSLSFLHDIYIEEVRHFQLLNEAVKRLGADPTAVTPCADVAAMMAKGLVAVVNDPRTNVAQSAHAILAAELLDNDGWDMLIRLTDEAGLREMRDQFHEAKEAEERHLKEIREWLQELVFENKVTRYQRH